MKVKTSELIGPALDWAVATCERVYMPAHLHDDQLAAWFLTHWTAKQGGINYSTDWSQGGPIIEREKIDARAPRPVWPYWKAYKPEWNGGSGMMEGNGRYGSTLLIAAMRCYVTSKLGDEVEIPDDLIAS